MASATNAIVDAVTNLPAQLVPPATNIVEVVTNTIWVASPPPAGLGSKDFLPFATALFGALAGASAGFFVGLIKQRRDKMDERHTALLQTQYALISQWTILQDIKKNHLDPVRNHPERFAQLPTFLRVHPHLPVPFDKLTFIIDSDEPDLLQDIHVAERSFLGVIEVLDECNEMRENIQNDSKPMAFDTDTGLGKLVLSAQVVFRIKRLTDLLYFETDKALPLFDKEVQNIYRYIKRNFRGRKGIQGIDCLPPANPDQQKNSCP